ncbi:DUF5707 domain-containing protein [Streptomyces sp. NPDC008125]|uniref:DUF5707 domain-containing protein n=1 Tax=Streptomyces sp. NPDC008125 TaxID=3364811 RepID=UPI0036E591F3
MSRRIALSVAAGVVALGGAGAFALAYADEARPLALAHSTARYEAPSGDRGGSLTFTTDVTASEGVRSVKVLAWPGDSTFAEQGLTEKEMASAEPAVCEPSGTDADTVRCTYEVTVTAEDAKDSPRGAWHVAVLATAKDGTTVLDTEAAGFTME